MKQSRGMSLAESVANAVFGFAIALGLNYALVRDVQLTLALFVAFTLASMARSYVIRRAFEFIRTRGIQ